MEKKLFAIECGNVILVVRPNGDTVIVTESNELVLDNAVMDQLVRNSGAYKSLVATKDDVVATKDDVVAGLERERIKPRNNIMEPKAASKAEVDDFDW